MLLKTIWISFAAFVLLGLIIFGGLGVSISPVIVEKEISPSQFPQ